MELEAMSRYTSPVNPAVFPHLTVVLLAIGMFFTAWFFVYPPATEQPGVSSRGHSGATDCRGWTWGKSPVKQTLGVEDEVGKAAWQKPFKPWKQSL
ncbi:dolichyl-diphosphooligosaccharide--protein glycosyltransferase subunit TMEM258 isoform X1 [Caretta caretta]|uniref:dolichyl-diphosphooligosaccharide--protein glycosyltransferase subunit TMEM258 isoform X1 n=1 Tax=Caretta caretta TaxID=8467 RepID=UPI003F4B24A9